MFTIDNDDFMLMTRERDLLTKLSPRNFLPERDVAYRVKRILPMGQYVFSDSSNGLRCGPVSDTLDTDDSLVK